MRSLRLKAHEVIPYTEDDAPQMAWTWSGRFFGYWVGRDLWTYKGKHIGRRRGFEIFSPSGRYLGELMGNKRLAINKMKAAHTGAPFLRCAPREELLCQPDRDPVSLYTGFDDFHHPEVL